MGPKVIGGDTQTKREAKGLLALEETNIIKGGTPAHMLKSTLTEILQDLKVDYKNNGKRLERLEIAIKHFREFFPPDLLARDLDTTLIQKYIKSRFDIGIKPPTVNRELNCLRKALRNAKQSNKLGEIPYIPHFKESLPREGFIEREIYLSLLKILPSYLKLPLSIGFYSGMRKGEILSLEWNQVDLMEGKINLRAAQTKTKQPRVFYLPLELKQMIGLALAERERSYPNCQLICSHDGKPIIDFATAWETAVRAIGKPDLLFHDLRRSGLRNLTRVGVQERVAMTISGHKTRSVFDRYNIINEEDQKEATKKLEKFFQEKEHTNDTVESTQQVLNKEN